MAKKPNETKLTNVGTSTGFVINKKVSALVGELQDIFKVDINTEKRQIILTNTGVKHEQNID